MVVEFTGFDRPWGLASVTRSSMMVTEGALTFESVPAGTRMCWSWDVRPRGAMRVMTPFVGVTAAGRSTASGATSSAYWNQAASDDERAHPRLDRLYFWRA
jgi:hypothetical protein